MIPPHNTDPIHTTAAGVTVLPWCWCDAQVGVGRDDDGTAFVVTLHSSAPWLWHAFAGPDGRPPA